MTKQPLLQLEPTELRIIYNSLEIDALKDVLLVVGYIKRYEGMDLEELRKEEFAIGDDNRTKAVIRKHIIQQLRQCKKQQ